MLPQILLDVVGPIIVLIGLGIVIAAAFWFMIPGAFGDWLRMVVSTVFGALSVMLPLALFGMAWRTMRDPAAMAETMAEGLARTNAQGMETTSTAMARSISWVKKNTDAAISRMRGV